MIKKAKGQILILILLIVVVALAISLSVASRNLTNIRTSTQTEQSQRAFSAAEGGVEDVLSRLNTIANDPNITTTGYNDPNLQVGSQTASVSVKGSRAYKEAIGVGEVGQIDLNNAFNNGVRTLVVEWSLKNPTNPEAAEIPAASVEFTFVCSNAYSVCMSATVIPAGQLYGQHREAYYVGSLQPGQSSSNSPPGGWQPCPDEISSVEFACRKTFSIYNNNVRILRIKPLYNNATVRVSSTDGTLPIQTYQISSTSQVEGVTRKVEVERAALATMPAVFDFGLYSETDIIK